MYVLKVSGKTVLKQTFPDWEKAIKAAADQIMVLFPQSEWRSLVNTLDKSGEIHGGGIHIEIFDKKMEAWH